MNLQFNQLKTTYNNSFQKQRAEIKVENSLYKRLLTPFSAYHLAFEPNEGSGIVILIKERRQIVATLDKIFDFFHRVQCRRFLFSIKSK